MHSDIIRRIISHSIQGNKIQPWIIIGPQSIGKNHVAYQIAIELLANNIGKLQAEILINNGSHPDLIIVSNLDGKSIGINEVREAQKFLQQKPILSEYKVCIIDSMDKISRQAANSLLKIIEEPNDKTLILLIATNIGNIIPTIRSRCMQININADLHASKTYIKNMLPETSESEIREALIISDGNVAKALAILQDQVLYWYVELLKGNSDITNVKENNIELYFDCLHRLNILLLHSIHDTLDKSNLIYQEEQYISKSSNISSRQALNLLDKVISYKEYLRNGTGSSKYMLQDLVYNNIYQF